MPKHSAPLSSSIDIPLLLITAVLVLVGTIMVFSSSVIMADARWNSPYAFVIKQIIWVVIGVGAMLAVSQIDYRVLQKYARPLWIVGVILLIAVLVIGTVKGGAKRWIRFGFFSFQPSELAKLLVVAALADYIDRKKSRLQGLKGVLPALIAIVGIPCGLIALEPDLGTPATIVAVSLALLFAAGARLKTMALLFMAVIPLGVEEILRKPYRLMRVKEYLESWGDIHSGLYQLNQSMLALGSGGFFGVGLAQSRMKMLFLPEPHTDFIFPVIGEELGFVGAVGVIVLFMLFAWRGWVISRRSDTYFGSVLALGLTWLVVFQALFNMGVATGLLPTKGLPLPFVSFGGTALLFYLTGVGILLSISARGKRKN